MEDRLKSREELLKTWEVYVSMLGYKVIRVWANEMGLYAQLKGQCLNPEIGFTQVLQGGTIVRLSYSDINNELITKNRFS
jgi:hypothetical protein